MKILFVDVDGVLNTISDVRNYGNEYICREKLHLLKHIAAETDCHIVLSSTWRLIPKYKDIVMVALTSVNLPLYGVTPNMKSRDMEIMDYLGRLTIPDIKYAIIDDCYSNFTNLKDGHNLFLVNENMGLTMKTAIKVIRHLNGFLPANSLPGV